jgi:hypothetical protein
MRLRHILIFVALCCGNQANAENCLGLYGAIKREAMYCDFFCNQSALAPLQQAYETNCIVITVPLASISSFENLPDEPGLPRHTQENKSQPSMGSTFQSEKKSVQN